MTTPAARASDDLVATLDGATIFRVFLKDGTSLLSYGEFARVDNRVVFSMPTSASISNPPLHLVNIDADHVNWYRTTRYAESVRATRYLATMTDSVPRQYEIGQKSLTFAWGFAHTARRFGSASPSPPRSGPRSARATISSLKISRSAISWNC